MASYLGGALGMAAAVIITLLMELHAQACLYPYQC